LATLVRLKELVKFVNIVDYAVEIIVDKKYGNHSTTISSRTENEKNNECMDVRAFWA
jgi:hypothetical protein